MEKRCGVQVGLVTCSDYPAITEDDGGLRDELVRRGAEVKAVPWDEEGDAAADCELLVVRSSWNYHRKAKEFLDWLARQEQAGKTILNPVETIKKNADKRYLLELERRGVAIVPTIEVNAVEGGAGEDGAGVLRVARKRGWERLVIKPAVSASGFRTQLCDRGQEAEVMSALAVATQGGAALVQPYIREIETEGEISFIFLGGVFSHAVRKAPAAGEFRVQHEFGGSATRMDADAAMVRQAAEIFEQACEGAVYARIDAVATAKGLLLMEVEMIEPALFLALEPASAAKFADAILAVGGEADETRSPRRDGE